MYCLSVAKMETIYTHTAVLHMAGSVFKRTHVDLWKLPGFLHELLQNCGLNVI